MPVVPVVPVVREQITAAFHNSLSAAHWQRTLPLADATAAATAAASRSPVEPVRSVAATGETPRSRSVPAARGPAQPRPAVPEPAGDPVDRSRPAAFQVDIERIVDKVHRKLMHRLAIEGERRGMTR